MRYLFFVLLLLQQTATFGFCQDPLNDGGAITTQRARQLLNIARDQWVLAEESSVHVQGTVRHHIEYVVNGKSTVEMESVVVFKRNNSGGLSRTRTDYPEGREPEIFIINPLYFAQLLPVTGSDRVELTFLDWLKKGKDPPVDHAQWNATDFVAQFTKPWYFDKVNLLLNDLVEHPDFEIKMARLENGVLTIDFDALFANPHDTGGYFTILGGRLELIESLNWFPQQVALNAGSSGRIVYSKKLMTLEYQETEQLSGNKFPLLARKRFTDTYVKPIPQTRIPTGITEIHDVKMELGYVKPLPADSEFRLSALGLPEPVRPGSMAATWWKWGGGMLVLGLIFAVFAMKFGRNR